MAAYTINAGVPVAGSGRWINHMESMPADNWQMQQQIPRSKVPGPKEPSPKSKALLQRGGLKTGKFKNHLQNGADKGVPDPGHSFS